MPLPRDIETQAETAEQGTGCRKARGRTDIKPRHPAGMIAHEDAPYAYSVSLVEGTSTPRRRALAPLEELVQVRSADHTVLEGYLRS